MIPDAIKRQEELLWSRRLVWLYFWLLIFEGALRKWIMPGLSTPLLIVRDPIVVLIYMLMASRNKFPMNGFVITSFALAFITGVLSMVAGHGNMMVTLFGMRTNFLHLPLIFVIPRLFNLEDIWRFGKAWMWLSIPMAFLIVAQFSSSPYHRLNAAVGGDLGSQLWGAAGHVRPSATFSFITGTVSFIAVTTAFAVAAFFDRRYRILRLLAFGATAVSVACSVSRSALVSMSIVLAAAGLIMLIQPAKFARGAMLFVAIGLLGCALMFTPAVKRGLDVFSVRLEETQMGQATAADGIKNRIFNDLLHPLQTYEQATLFGEGTGAGTNVAAGLMNGGRGFLLAELEWSRILLESGVIFGTAIILLRVVLSFYLVYWSWICLKSQNSLPWLLTSAVFIFVFNAQWGQPTALGFATLGAGFVLAATRPAFSQTSFFQKAAQSIKS